MNSINKERFEYLDGIRGVAALIVVISHFNKAFNYETANNFLLRLFWNSFDVFFLHGDFCVEIFFVLSGFVLAYNSFNRPNFLNKQWLKRLYRLAVPVFITSAIYFVFSNNNLFYFSELGKIHYTDWASQHWQVHYSLPQFIVRCLYDFMLFSDWQFVMNINSSLWTIPIELYWSYLLFILFFVLNKLNNYLLKNVVLLFYTGIVLCFLKFKGIEFGVLFFLGTLIALNYDNIVSKYNSKGINIISIIIVTILTYIVELNVLSKYEFSFISWHNFMAFIYIVLAIRINILQIIFSMSVIKWLGRISFSLYLLHILIIGSLSSKLFIVYPYFRTDFGLVLLLIITLAILTLIAHLYTIYIDEKLMKYYDKVYNYLADKINIKK